MLRPVAGKTTYVEEWNSICLGNLVDVPGDVIYKGHMLLG